MQPVLIPDNLKKSRERLGITRVEAARRMSIPQSSYVRYEKGDRKPTLATITQMAQALGSSVDYLIGETDDDVADTVLVHKNDEPMLYDITSGAKSFNEKQLKRLYLYYEAVKKSIDEQKK